MRLHGAEFRLRPLEIEPEPGGVAGRLLLELHGAHEAGSCIVRRPLGVTHSLGLAVTP
ncbi:MAG: hypothetical protein ABSF73_08760 [Terriglobia bacterium]